MSVYFVKDQDGLMDTGGAGKLYLTDLIWPKMKK